MRIFLRTENHYKYSTNPLWVRNCYWSVYILFGIFASKSWCWLV